MRLPRPVLPADGSKHRCAYSLPDRDPIYTDVEGARLTLEVLDLRLIQIHQITTPQALLTDSYLLSSTIYTSNNVVLRAPLAMHLLVAMCLNNYKYTTDPI
jgi:hypothetical protein